ncbi:MAG: flagellar hook-length control protein FliK, partial [Chromatocurvus sp.]
LVTAQRPSGDLVLRVAGQQITARADLPVQQGTHLLLEVKQLQPQVVLKIIPQAPQGMARAQASAGTAPAQAATGGLLRLLAPEGAGLGARSVADVVDTLRALQTALPTGNGNPAQRLLASLPGLADLLSASGLRRAFTSSGHFLEATLARATTVTGARAQPVENDVKALLMRVLEQVNAALQRTAGDATAAGRAAFLAEAQRDLEFVLGGITLNQLQSQPGENAALRGWIVDVPFVLGQHVHNMRVRVDRDGAEKDSGEDGSSPRWRVELELDLPELGPLLLTTRLQAETVAVELAARESRTRDLLMARAGELVAALDGVGLEVPSLQVTTWPQRGASDAAAADESVTASQQSWRA